MTILIEAISIVLRCDSLERLSPEILDQFYSSIPNQTYCSDGRLARVAFLDNQDANGFILFLETLGLVHLQDEESVDFTIALQGHKDSSRCGWLERFEIESQGTMVDVAAYVDAQGNIYLEKESGGFIAPDSWSLDQEIIRYGSRNELTYVKSKCLNERGIIDHYRALDGRIVYVGRQKRWFDLPFLCLLRMPLRLCMLTSALGAVLGMIFFSSGSGWIQGFFLGGLFGLVLCSQFAKNFPMTPLWIIRILGG